jgi:hypothetical protein
MSNGEQLILEICKRKSKNEYVQGLINRGQVDWRHVLELLSYHKIAPFALAKIKDFSLPPSAKNIILQKYKKEVIRATIRNTTLKVKLKEVLITLKKNNIKAVLLKGLSLDYDELRFTGDIDLLVRKDDLKKAILTLEKINYLYVGHLLNSHVKKKEKKSIDLQLLWNNQYQFYNNDTGTLLELHTNLFERSRVYVEDIEALLDNIELFWKDKQYNKKLNCYTLSRENLLMLMCLQNGIKRSPANNTFILITLLDIDNITAGEINWKGFIEGSIEMKIEPYVYFSLLMTTKLLDTKIDDEVLNALESRCTKKQSFLIRLHLKCSKSLYTRSLFYAKLYKFLCPFILGKRWSDRINWLFLIPLLFPPRRQMARYFNLRKSSPLVYFTYLLNPGRWIYLIVRNIVSR